MELQTKAMSQVLHSIDLAGNVAVAWANFKLKHDYKSLKISCCDRSKALFADLDALEAFFEHYEQPKGK